MNIYHNKTTKYILFLINPFWVFLSSIFNMEKSWSKNILWLFVAYFGFTMVSASSSADMLRASIKLDSFHGQSLNLESVVAMVYSDSSNYVDFLQPLITYIVSLFTNNSRILFLVFSIIFGYFYSRNISYIYNKLYFKKSAMKFILLTLIYVIIPYWYVNGFRFFTATQVFLYCLLPLIIEKKNNKMYLFLILPFIHFSYIVPTIIVLAFWFRIIPHKITILFLLFMVTFFIGEIQLASVQDTMMKISPTAFEDRIDQYVDQDVFDRTKEIYSKRSWHARIYGNSLKYSLMALVGVFYFRRKKEIERSDKLKYFYSFLLLYLIFANLATNIPSGGRFMLPGLFLISVFIITYKNEFAYSPIIDRSFILLSPLIVFYLIVQIRTGLDFHSIVTIIGNPIFSIMVDPKTPLIHLIK